jgi:glycosyltransferase involved in cell wall biosynthesis
MKTVVSLVPLAMERDTRTIKIASSFARLGYRSVVVEALPSRRRDHAGIDLVTLGRVPPATGGTPADRRPRAGVGSPWRQWLGERLHFALFLLRYFVALPLLALLRVPRADLYYLHEYRLFPTVWLLRRLRGGAPLIYDAHDVYAEVWEPEQLSPFWRSRFVPLLLAMERACAREARAVVTVGEGVAEAIGRWLAVAPVVLRNCHDDRLRQSPPQTLRRHLGLPPDAVLVVVIGHRKPGQVLEPLAAALADLPDRLHVAFVGSFYDVEVAELAVRHNLSGRLHAPGAMASEQMVAYVADADAAALLYWGHSANTRYILPNGFFQSVAAGLPLLYPDLPELTRLVGGRNLGWCIDPRDRLSLTLTLTALLALDDVARQAVRAEVAAVASTLTWEGEESVLASLTETILKEDEP